MKYEIKQLSLGGILDQAFSIIRDHIGLLFGIVATTIIPLQIVMGFLQLEALKAGGGPGNVSPMTAVLILVSLFVGLPLGVLVNAAVIHAVACVYLSRPTTIGECFRHGLKRFLPLLGTSLLMGLAIMGGMMLCIIPGIIVAFWFALGQHVTVLEGTAGSPALKRSRTLMKGNFVTAFVLGLIIAVISVCLALIAQMIPQIHLQVVTSAIIQGVTTLIATAAFVVFYFSCRCKLENFDLLVLAEAVGDENLQGNLEDVPETDRY
jgi:uncharacterized protein (DUF486 family)